MAVDGVAIVREDMLHVAFVHVLALGKVSALFPAHVNGHIIDEGMWKEIHKANIGVICEILVERIDDSHLSLERCKVEGVPVTTLSWNLNK